jgi:hypothetical protein
MKQMRSAIVRPVYLRQPAFRRCGYDGPVRRFVLILTLLAVLAAAFAIAWFSVGWPGICEAHGWCRPGSFLPRSPAHN